MKKTFLLITFILLCLLGACTLFRDYIPGPADMTKVAERLPQLEEQLPRAELRLAAPVFIRIFKEEAVLELWLGQDDGTFRLFKTYPVCAYSGTLGPKQQEGDEQAPEGFYTVSQNQMKPDSRYHLAFNIGFPNAYDRAQGYSGSYLMVHGSCISVGCYAMGNKAIEEIYLLAQAALDKGQDAFAVHIFPFRLTPENLLRHRHSAWLPFWRQLQEGYDAFETFRIPPDMRVIDGNYRLAPSETAAQSRAIAFPQ